MHKLPKALTFMGALLALTFCAVSCKTDDDNEPTMYTVTVSDSLEHGKVTADKSSAEAGATVKLTATADSGYELDSYSVKDASANELTVTEGTFTMPKSNVTVSATFKETAETASYTVKHLQQNIADDNYTLKESETKTGTVGQSTAASAKSYDGFTAQTVTQVTVAASGTEVEIKYDRKSYTVTFDSNSGSDVSSQSLRYEAKATEPADPTKTATASTEYTFAGWYTDSGLESAFDFETAITADITLYAKWTINTIKIAGSISYETAIVDKQNGDSNFTNNLTITGDGTVSYTSSKSGVAIVDETTGEVTIRGAGITTITATVTDSDTYTYATNTASYKLLVFRAGKDEVSAGDIAVSSDGGSTLKYVAYDYDLYNLNDYSGSGYEAIGVCVNTEFMIYYEYEWLTYAEAMPEYPQTPDGWTMPTNAQLETIFSNYQILGISARVAGSSDSSLYAKEAWSSERSTNGYPYYYAMAYGRAFVSTGDPSECIVILVRDLEVTPTTYIGSKAPTEAKAVGDIVFSDGSATPYSTDLTLSDAQKEAAVAVIYYAGSSAEDVLGAKTLGVGLKNASTLAWAISSAAGNSTNITDIQCTRSETAPTDGTAYYTYTSSNTTYYITGDLDGSDNWKALCDTVSDEGTSGNYPAWKWVNAYATTASLTGDYASGWYLPTVAELCMLYRAKDTVNAALKAAGGTKIADTGYWSSSQVSSHNLGAWIVWFDDGSLSDSNKTSNDVSVCGVRAF
ncbi:MAG: InlB B-repeat-containing protein [Treponema sp.]|nr:InlB B-repeat-containing protein [Treponema sp.]